MQQTFSSKYLNHEGKWEGSVGYTDRELVSMENALDVSITGDFRLFMKEFGRSTGPVIGERFTSVFSRFSIYFIDPTLFEEFCDLQRRMKDEIEKAFSENMIDTSGWFFFYIVEDMDACLFFKTKSSEPDQVWRYVDESEIEYEEIYCDVRHESFGEFLIERSGRNDINTHTNEYSSNLVIP